MKLIHSSYFNTTIRIFFYSVILTYNVLAYADNFTQARWQFNNALSALQTNDLSTFQQLTYRLQNYPLYYYLRYQYLNPRLTQVPATEVYEFLRQYGNTMFGNSLRQTWLDYLAKQGDWAGFIQAYTPQKSAALQCYYVQARLAIRQATQEALEDGKKLWLLVDKSQPTACNVAFNYLAQSGILTTELIWQRIELAMAKNNLEVTNAAAKLLGPTDQMWVTLWLTMHQNPAQTLGEFNYSDTPIIRNIVLHGIKRLAAQQFDLATNYWDRFQRRYAFTSEQIGDMQRELALASVKTQHPQALFWLTAVNKNFLTDGFNETRIIYALERQQWQAVEDFISELPEPVEPFKASDLRWRYWLARALEQNGKTTQARTVYQTLAKERDYYGFLAADRIKTSYQMRHNPITFTPAEQTELMKVPSLAASYEFYQLRMMTQARQEWQYTMELFTLAQQAIAAALASRWGWHPQAILAAGKAGAYDDLEVRFPILFRSQLTAGANRQGIDLAWVYGITRQESVFNEDARSPAGALGLMQLMPATARLVAKSLGLTLNGNSDILEASTNISLGTAYLRQMLNQFSGNHLLATAAYNAGPGRAKRWAENNPCLAPDLWVEMIPFKETRSYVRLVLFYTRVFEERLGQPQRPIRVTLRPYSNCGGN